MNKTAIFLLKSTKFLVAQIYVEDESAVRIDSTNFHNSLYSLIRVAPKAECLEMTR